MDENLLQEMLMSIGLNRFTFTKSEVEKTGGNLEKMDPLFWRRLIRVRKELDAPIHFFKNGLNSGDHSSIGHPKGFACDFWTPAEPKKVFYSAVNNRLLKIGVYQNERKAYGYHLELSDTFATWYGHREEAGAPWVMESIFKVF